MNLKFRHELAARALVPVRSLTYSAVGLFQRLESKTRETQPRGADRGLLPDAQIQALYRKEICRWAEIEIDVLAPSDGRAQFVVQSPRAICASADLDLDAALADLTCNLRGQCGPVLIARNLIFETAGLFVVIEKSYADQQPCGFLLPQLREFMTRPVESPPQDTRCLVCHSSPFTMYRSERKRR